MFEAKKEEKKNKDKSKQATSVTVGMQNEGPVFIENKIFASLLLFFVFGTFRSYLIIYNMMATENLEKYTPSTFGKII